MSLPAQNIKIINNTFLKFQTQRQKLAHLHLSKSKFTYQIQSMESQYAFPMSATTAESSPKLPQLLGNHSAIKLHLHHSQNMLLLTIDKLPLNIRSISVPLHNISPYFKSIRFSRHRDSVSPKQIQENPLRAKFKTPSQDVFLITRMGENGVYG